MIQIPAKHREAFDALHPAARAAEVPAIKLECSRCLVSFPTYSFRPIEHFQHRYSRAEQFDHLVYCLVILGWCSDGDRGMLCPACCVKSKAPRRYLPVNRPVSIDVPVSVESIARALRSKDGRKVVVQTVKRAQQNGEL